MEASFVKQNVLTKQRRRPDVLRCQGATQWTSGASLESAEATLQDWKSHYHHEHTAKEVSVAELVETKCLAQPHDLQNQGFLFDFCF